MTFANRIYTRFYHIESIVKRMQIAMSVIEIFQITPTLSSLNDAQRVHLNKVQQGIHRVNPSPTTLYTPKIHIKIIDMDGILERQF